jgi:internalin A
MSKDLDIIKRLERELGITFEAKFDDKIHWGKSYAQYALNEFEQVIKLRLSGLLLKRIPTNLPQLQHLQWLDLSSNKLIILSVKIAKLQNLQRLYLSDNQLKNWPVEIAQLENLQELDLMNNQLTTWPIEMALMPQSANLHPLGLYLGGNPLKTPPIEVIEQGNKAIIEYYKSLQGKQKRRLNEVKVLLVGDGGAGKTSLVKQLFGEDFNFYESQTHGIQIKPWEVNEGDNTIKVHLWDFGGQEIMHATHQFFLSKRSLYILVLDGRKEEKTEYWLKHIESFGSTSPILVVLNKMDENPGFDVNRKFLKDKYQGIQGFFQLSCKTGQGLDEFRQALQDGLTQVEIHQTIWGEAWFNVKQQLEQMSEPFINYERYQAMCRAQTIMDNDAQTVLVGYLHDLGVILHFKELALEDTHVLEPKWATHAVYKIINAPQVANNKGILAFNQLATILKPTEDGDYEYPRDKHHYIIELMKKFELCYDLPNEQVLIPDLLEVQEPDFAFDSTGALQFRIDYDFLPKSVMPRFIVRRHRDIKENLRWRTGVVLSDKAFQATAVVKSDNEARKIYIEVGGPQRRDYFAIVRKTFQDINNSFKKLKVDERVCLPENPDITVSLAHLYHLEAMGQTTYIPEGANKPYNVRELLGTIINENNREEELFEKIDKIDQKLDKPNISVSAGVVSINNLDSEKFTPLWKWISQPISFKKFGSLKKLLLSKTIKKD